MNNQSLQQFYAPQGICFGCGPANNKGLRINSFPKDDKVICEWHPQDHHQAFPGILCGGIIGSLLDCHCNWTAAYHLMKKNNCDVPPCTVTAEYSIKLLHPTPTDRTLRIEAKIIDASNNRATVEGEIIIDDKVYDTCRGIFIAVKPDHPAYHRW